MFYEIERAVRQNKLAGIDVQAMTVTCDADGSVILEVRSFSVLFIIIVRSTAFT